METPNYIKSLVTPTTKQPQGRKVWSIDLQQVWLPFFTANLLNYTGSVMRDNAEGYKAQIETARKAGEPIYQHDKNQLSNALKARVEAEAEAQAEAAEKEEEAVAKAKGKKELVHA